MPIRSWMFVPGDSDKKLGKAPDLGADVIIIDLEDSVAPSTKEIARALTGKWLEEKRAAGGEEGAPQYWVRINPLDTALWHQDLDAVLGGKPTGVMVPKAEGPDQLRKLVEVLYELEPRNGISPGSTKILPLVSETPYAANRIANYGSREHELPRLSGLSWGAEDLSAAIGASRKRDDRGIWTDLFRMVRAQVLLAAHAAGVSAIDTLHADFRDVEGLKRVAREGYEDGFAGMLAIHPSQVAIINEAFSPSEEELAEAQAIVDLFAENPGAGALQLEGRMIDQPHLVQAQKLLDRAS